MANNVALPVTEQDNELIKQEIGRDFIKEYEACKNNDERKKVLSDTIAEITLWQNREAQKDRAFQGMAEKYGELQKEYERLKVYYAKVLRYMRTQVTAFYDAFIQAVGGDE